MSSPENKEDEEEIQKISKNFFNLIKGSKEGNRKLSQKDELQQGQKQGQQKQKQENQQVRRSTRNSNKIQKKMSGSSFSKKFQISDEEQSENESLISQQGQKYQKGHKQQQYLQENQDSESISTSNQKKQEDEEFKIEDEEEFLPESSYKSQKQKNKNQKLGEQKKVGKQKVKKKSQNYNINNEDCDGDDESNLGQLSKKRESVEEEGEGGQLEVIQKKRLVSQDLSNQQQQEVIDLKTKTIADYVQDSLTRKPKSQNNSRRPSVFIDNYQNDSNFQENESFQYQDGDNIDHQMVALQSIQNSKMSMKDRRLAIRKQVSSSSFVQRPNSMNKKWNDKETSTFYKCLGYFGTDFTTINQYLKTKTVTQIKNKFNKEEKKNPDKIKEALKSKKGKQGLSKLKDTQQLENLKNHYDSKFDIRGQIIQEQIKQNIQNEPPKMINSEQQILDSKQQQQMKIQQQPKRYLEDIQEDYEDDELLNFQPGYIKQPYSENKNNNNNLIEDQFEQQLEINKKSSSQLSQSNIGLLMEQTKGQQMDYMQVPRHRKDSQTSNDSVARNIEEHIIQIYNKEVENHNNQIKGQKYSEFTQSVNANDSGGEISGTTSTKSAHQNNQNNINQNQILI